MDAVADRPLGRVRVLEMPGAEGALCGRSFADLGADVIKIEPPSGDPSRRLPPFSASGGSLYWAVYAAGKRSVALDLETERGRARLLRLVRISDVLIDTDPTGRQAALHLDYPRLCEENPALVLTSISPFGRSGPYARRKGSDLVQFAMSGYLHMTGPAGGPPLKVSAPYQTWLHGSMHAFAATLLALRQRRRTGHGADVDQALRDTGAWMLTHTYQFWDLLGVNLTRQGASRDMGGVLRLPTIWPARDGHIIWLFQTGYIGGSRMRQLVAWMAEHGMAPAFLHAIEWESFDLLGAGAAQRDQLVAAFTAFFAAKTRAELFAWALPRGVMLAPMQTLRNLADDPQLSARGAWLPLAAEQSAGARLPGAPVRMSAARWERRGPAPALDEHNHAVLGDLLGEAVVAAAGDHEAAASRGSTS
ncbi:MAG TPA: CoA transferase [Dehalococcoidia bacterium]|nr:CoA transferase [Dehalococcoidia bacterium]